MNRKIVPWKEMVHLSDTAIKLTGLRVLMLGRAENGLAASGASLKIGKHVYFDVDLFNSWLLKNYREPPSVRVKPVKRRLNPNEGFSSNFGTINTCPDMGYDRDNDRVQAVDDFMKGKDYD